MATTTCPKCPSTRFEVKETSVSGSNFRVIFIQCATCGAAISTTEVLHTNTLIKNLAKKLGFTL